MNHNTLIFVSARDGSNGDGIDSRTGDSYKEFGQQLGIIMVNGVNHNYS